MMSVKVVHSEIIKKGNQKHTVTELDRLSYVVSKIDQECAIVPYQSQKSTLTGELVPNVGFEGQAPEDICQLSNYRHLRDTEEEKKLRIFGRDE